MPRIITRPSPTSPNPPPLTFGPQRIHYEYSVALPEIHLTFVSVLQSLAFGVLLISMPLPRPADTADLLSFCLRQYAYLPYLVSGLLILLIWKQFIYNSMYAIWPPTTRQMALVLLISVTQILAFRLITNFNAWLLGMGATGCVGGVIRLTNLRLHAPDYWEAPENARTTWLGQIFHGSLYVLLGILTIGGGVAFGRLGDILPGWSGPQVAALQHTIEWATLLALLLILGIVGYLDARLRDRVMRAALHHSDLELTRAGAVRYRADSNPTLERDGAAVPSRAAAAEEEW